MNISIKTIPHIEQRYNTVGDWFYDKDGNIEIRISDCGNWKYESLVALHELIEILLCKDRGVAQEAVDKFDMGYSGDNPGSDISAPYYREHVYATAVEYSFLKELGVDAKNYEASLDNIHEQR